MKFIFEFVVILVCNFHENILPIIHILHQTHLFRCLRKCNILKSTFYWKIFSLVSKSDDPQIHKSHVLFPNINFKTLPQFYICEKTVSNL